jgi:hypothetical protein
LNEGSSGSLDTSVHATDAAPMFYGWTIVGVAFLTQFIAVGFTFYSYGVFFKALAADFGDSAFSS